MKKTDKVFYVPGKPGIIDIVMEDGKSQIMRETLEEMDKRYPGVQIGDFDTVAAASREAFISPPVKITREQFIKSLEVLPPVAWTSKAGAESFKLSEQTYDDITAIFCRIGKEYYQLYDSILMPHELIVDKCRKAGDQKLSENTA